MTESYVPFDEEIEANKAAEIVPSEVAGVVTDDSLLEVRLRGGFIIDCELTSPTTGERVDVLYSQDDLEPAKITATHVMMPAGPSAGIGDQHGFPRWADYHEFPVLDGPEGEKRVAFQAQRSDTGLSMTKAFGLEGSALTSHTTTMSSEAEPARTSLGEHLYFALEDERMDGLKINGLSLDELLGEGSEDTVKSQGTLFWHSFDGEAVIDFPAGHSVRLSAGFTGETASPLALWIWHREDSPSICFEPVVGVDEDGQNDGVELEPYGSATLSTKIELL